MTAIQKRRVRKWIAALRSGEYKQGHRVLKSSAGYCCLGVACVVAGRAIRDAEEFLPEPIIKYYGLKNKRGIYAFSSRDLVNDNDSRNHSFKQIALTIEQQLVKNTGLFA